MKGKGTTIRSVRIDDDTWTEIAELAERRGTDRSEVLLAAYEHVRNLKGFNRPPAAKP